MFIFPVVEDHLSWETTKFSGHFHCIKLTYDILEGIWAQLTILYFISHWSNSRNVQITCWINWTSNWRLQRRSVMITGNLIIMIKGDLIGMITSNVIIMSTGNLRSVKIAGYFIIRTIGSLRSLMITANLIIMITGNLRTVFKISAGPRTLTAKTGIGPASFPSIPYINLGKIVLLSGKFHILFWTLWGL